MNTITIPSDIVMRPARDGEQQAIAAMLHACERAYLGTEQTPFSATLEWIHTTWTTGGFDLEADSLVAVTADEQIVGYVTTWRSEDEPHRMVAWPRIHPDHRGKGLSTWMLRWAERRARQIAATLPEDQEILLFSWVENVDGAAKEILAREQFLPERYWWQMEIQMEAAPPAPTWPDGMRVRTFMPGQDEQTVHQALAEAFSTNGDEPYSSFEEWLRYGVESESFDPALWFLAVEGNDEIAGVILCELRTDSNRGWISEAAVRPRWRKRGLGQALLYHAFGEFYQRNTHKCALAVDSENPSGATRLYERVGMHANNHVEIQYKKVLRAARKQHA